MKLAMRVATAALTICASVPALAQDSDTGVYVSANAGVSTVNDLDVTYYGPGGTFGGTGTSDTAEFSFDTKSAAAFRGAIGYDFGTVRADVEVSYQRNKVSGVTLERINGAAVPTLTAADRADVCDYLEADTCGGSGNTFEFDGSRARQLSALANVWLDLPVGPVTPYIGGGVGATGYELDGEGKAVFAWQLGAGAAFNLSPSVALTADYRYRQAKGVRIEDEDFPGEGLELDNVKSSTFSAGVRFRF